MKLAQIGIIIFLIIYTSYPELLSNPESNSSLSSNTTSNPNLNNPGFNLDLITGITGIIILIIAFGSIGIIVYVNKKNFKSDNSVY